MKLGYALEARQQQTQRIDPRQIQASEILAWNSSELEVAIERELAENPALDTREGESLADIQNLSASSLSLTASNLLTASAQTFNAEKNDGAPDGNRNESIDGDGALAVNRSTTSNANALNYGMEDEGDPMDRVASGLSLRDHLRGQVAGIAPDPFIRAVVAYLIESLDERGYLVTSATEVAEQFQVSAACIEPAVRALQMMDPPGVGARDLRECLLLQVEHLEQTGEAHPLARRVLSRCWDDLVARREERIAARLRVTVGDVRAAVRFLRGALSPHPGASFRPEWSSRVADGCAALSAGAPVRPDIIFHRSESGVSIETPRDFETVLVIAPLWKRMADRPDHVTDDATRRYVRDHVDRAQAFLSGVARRGLTLRRIAAALVDRQQGYLLTGNRAFLRPLTRQSLAEALGLDESVISRAVADKWAQLPTGDVVALDTFFGNAHAVRDALVQIVASENQNRPHSDDEIADLLNSQGFTVARRTVAKYRGQEKILPARLRRRAPVERRH